MVILILKQLLWEYAVREVIMGIGSSDVEPLLQNGELLADTDALVLGGNEL